MTLTTGILGTSLSQLPHVQLAAIPEVQAQASFKASAKITPPPVYYATLPTYSASASFTASAVNYTIAGGAFNLNSTALTTTASALFSHWSVSPLPPYPPQGYTGFQ